MEKVLLHSSQRTPRCRWTEPQALVFAGRPKGFVLNRFNQQSQTATTTASSSHSMLWYISGTHARKQFQQASGTHRILATARQSQSLAERMAVQSRLGWPSMRQRATLSQRPSTSSMRIAPPPAESVRALSAPSSACSGHRLSIRDLPQPMRPVHRRPAIAHTRFHRNKCHSCC